MRYASGRVGTRGGNERGGDAAVGHGGRGRSRFGEWLARELTDTGLTPAALAAVLGVAPEAVAAWLADEVMPETALLMGIATLLRIPPATIRAVVGAGAAPVYAGAADPALDALMADARASILLVPDLALPPRDPHDPASWLIVGVLPWAPDRPPVGDEPHFALTLRTSCPPAYLFGDQIIVQPLGGAPAVGDHVAVRRGVAEAVVLEVDRDPASRAFVLTAPRLGDDQEAPAASFPYDAGAVLGLVVGTLRSTAHATAWERRQATWATTGRV
jgi:transcriptional regulator with XRE-family HTH domain